MCQDDKSDSIRPQIMSIRGIAGIVRGRTKRRMGCEKDRLGLPMKRCWERLNTELRVEATAAFGTCSSLSGFLSV